jgi:hypothetical protein
MIKSDQRQRGADSVPFFRIQIWQNTSGNLEKNENSVTTLEQRIGEPQMYNNLTDNLRKVSRDVGVPYPTLWTWVRTRKIILPDDFERLKTARKVEGRWYLPDKGNDD